MIRVRLPNMDVIEPIVPGPIARIALFTRRILARPSVLPAAMRWYATKYLLRRRVMIATVMGNKLCLDLRSGGISRAVAREN